MSFFVHHRFHGDDERDPSPAIFPLLLDELDEDPDDEEHLSVGVIHESEWGLSFYRGGYVAFENVEDEDAAPRHMQGISREKAIEMMVLLSKGELDALERELWQPGY